MPTLTNAYATVGELAGYLSSTIAAQTALEDRAVDALNASSRQVDQWCGDRFYADSPATARTFRAWSSTCLDVPSISTTTQLAVATDINDDGTFAQAWTSSDWIVEPSNWDTSGEDRPITRLVAVESLTFPTAGRRPRVQVTARWGWPAVPEPVRQATLLIAARLLRRADSPEGVAGFGEFGPIRVTNRMDPDAAALLAPYRRAAVLVA